MEKRNKMNCRMHSRTLCSLALAAVCAASLALTGCSASTSDAGTGGTVVRVNAAQTADTAQAASPSDTVTVTSPVQNGVIADFDKTVMMLRDYIRRCRTGFGSVSAVVSIPCRATPVEKRAVADAVRAAGVKKVPFVVEKPIAAALGSGLSIFEPRGRMVVDIGGGTTEISVPSLGRRYFF